MRMRWALTAVFVAVAWACAASAEETPGPQTVEDAYPGLVNGALASATVGDLPDGVVLDMGDARITRAQVQAVVDGAADDLKEQLGKNRLYLVQEMATKKLLLRAAQEWASKEGIDLKGRSEPQAIAAYLHARVADLAVTDAEVAEFYAGNTEMFDGAGLDELKGALKQYLVKEKRQDATDEHVRSLAGIYGVVISRAWLTQQAVAATDNPVDKARQSGLPTLVDFGAEGCRPCDMLAPILEELKTKYAGKVNVVFVHVQKEPVLAARYGIRSIPVQVFYDRDGREVFRHTGFIAQEKIEEKFGEMAAE
jgi:thiol-disulfide isomerase/thioredoxin